MIKPDYHVVNFSGGKDSTAMLLRMIELNYPIDEVLTFDTGMEFPDMYLHIDRVFKILKEKNIKTTVLKSPYTFEFVLIEKERIGKDNIIRHGFGWPNMSKRWCTALLKKHLEAPWLNNLTKDYNVIRYLGIANDEKQRLKKKIHNDGSFEYPLVTWGMSEKDCLKYCYDRGYDWNGLYENFRRVSCWCCPLKSIKEHYTLWEKYPELWAKLKEWDTKLIETYGLKTMPQYRGDLTIEDLEKRFIIEKKRKSQNINTCSKNFYREISLSISGIDKRQKTLEGY